MGKIFKIIFGLSLILTFAARNMADNSKVEPTSKVEKKQKVQKPMVYFWEKSTVACISEQTLDSFMSAYYQNDQSSMNKYLTMKFCYVSSGKKKITMLDRGMMGSVFLIKGIKLYANNSAITYE
jgi:hypothetical protein